MLSQARYRSTTSKKRPGPGGKEAHSGKAVLKGYFLQTQLSLSSLVARQRYDQAPKDWDESSDLHSSRFGLDVGDGGDPHALARWCGPVLYSIAKMPTRGDMLDANRAAGMSSRQMKAYPGSGSTIDRGFGSGVIGILKEQELNAHGGHWGQAARDNKTYLNAKAEDFWLLREALRKGEVAIAPGASFSSESGSWMHWSG